MHRHQWNVAKTAFVLAFALALVSPPSHPAPAASTERDGQHDFDFLLGRWKVHLKRRSAGAEVWTESDGYGVYRQIWGGRANINEFFTANAAGLVEGLTLRTYNPETHRWSLYWANSRDGILSTAQVGRFVHGVGEFYAMDDADGRNTLIRYVWSKVTPTSAHFEQALSSDGGQRWEVNWISDMVRTGEADTAHTSGGATAGEQPGQRGFEPILGRWNYRLTRRLHPLTGSSEWVELKGTGECTPLWGGRAQLDTLTADGASGHIEGLTLRLFNPKTQEWRLYWANAKDGLVVSPQIGHFTAGHGEFFAQDTLDDKSILIKYDWSALDSALPHFEQSFSNDGGKSWEINWITEQSRTD